MVKNYQKLFSNNFFFFLLLTPLSKFAPIPLRLNQSTTRESSIQNTMEKYFVV